MGMKLIIMFKHVLLIDDDLVDISRKKLILWGAGGSVRDFAMANQIDDIAFIVDGLYSSVGKSIFLHGKKHIISSPVILDEINAREYCILIASRWENDIRKTIHERWGNDDYLVASVSAYRRQFFELESMFHTDPFLLRLAIDGNVSLSIPFLIDNLKGIISSVLKSDTGYYYIPIRWGMKLHFVVGINGKKLSDAYVCCVMPQTTPNDEEKKSIFELKSALKINKAFTVYEDENVNLSHYGSVCTTRELKDENTLKEVLSKIKLLHDSKYSLGWEKTLINIIGYNQSKQTHRDLDVDDVLLCERMKTEIYHELDNYVPVVVHGDLWQNNILKWRDEIFFIDWDFMGMGDRMFDVCYLFSRTEACKYCDLYDGLFLYYQRKPEFQELRHAQAAFIGGMYMEYTHIYNNLSSRDNHKVVANINAMIDNFVYRIYIKC